MNQHLLSRRDWVKSSAAFCVAVGATAHPNEAAAQLPALGKPLSPLGRELLGATDPQLANLELGRKRGLIEMAAVHLPEDPPSLVTACRDTGAGRHGYQVSRAVAVASRALGVDR